jgi:hypothetical protein
VRSGSVASLAGSTGEDPPETRSILHGTRYAPAALLMRLLVAALAVFASLLLYVTPARAQATISVANEASLPRLDSSGNQVQKRDRNLNPEAVNFQDCKDDQRMRFTLQMAGFVADAVIQVWAANGGVDCGVNTNRSGAAQQCWQVSENVPLQQLVNVDIPVRRIMSGVSPFTALNPNATEGACGQVNLANISVQFLYFAPGNLNAPASKKDVAVTVDTVGPRPPTGLRTSPGNQRLFVTWDNISGEGGVTALTAVRAYCTPATVVAPTTTKTDGSCTLVPREAAVADASDPDAEAGVEDAGFEEVCTDGTTNTTEGDECAAPVFESDGGSTIDGGSATGLVPDKEFNAQYLCGESVGATGTTARAETVGGKPLANGTVYAVAVAGTDQFGNVGILSDVLCEKPEETTDFWEGYRSSGGQAGGGFCTASAVGIPAGSMVGLGLACAVALSSLRRRMKDRR